MNPDTNMFEKLTGAGPSEQEAMIKRLQDQLAASSPYSTESYPSTLYRPNGEPVPKTWSIFTEGEHVVVKDYTFKVVRIGEGYLVLEPVGPLVVGETG